MEFLHEQDVTTEWKISLLPNSCWSKEVYIALLRDFLCTTVKWKELTYRNVYAGVLCFYAQLLNELENNGIFDPLNDLHLYCLHSIYLPRINRSLEEF